MGLTPYETQQHPCLHQCPSVALSQEKVEKIFLEFLRLYQ